MYENFIQNVSRKGTKKINHPEHYVKFGTHGAPRNPIEYIWNDRIVLPEYLPALRKQFQHHEFSAYVIMNANMGVLAQNQIWAQVNGQNTSGPHGNFFSLTNAFPEYLKQMPNGPLPQFSIPGLLIFLSKGCRGTFTKNDTSLT